LAQVVLDPAGERLGAVLDIVDAVAGMPLAIELAAAWVRLLPPAEIARDLRGSVALLERDPSQAGALARPEHVSLAAVLDQAHAMLAPTQRQAMLALAVFEGGFSHAAARAVTGASVAMLSSLVDCSLLAVDAAGRFAMHPVVAAWAAQRLDDDATRAAAIRERHAEHLAQWLAGRAGNATFDQRSLARDVATEFANVCKAWRWAIAQRRADLACLMIRPMWVFFDHGGRLVEGVALLRPALGLSPADATGRLAMIRCRHGLAYLLYRQGEFAQALAVAEPGMTDGADFGEEGDPDHGDKESWIGCWLIGGACLIDLGQPDRALARFERALAMARRHGDPHSIGWAMGYVAAGCDSVGRSAEAVGHFEQALAIMRSLDDHHQVAEILHNLGNLYRKQRDWAHARDCMEQGLAHCRRHGIAAIARVTPIVLGTVLVELGDLAGARHHLQAGHDDCFKAGLTPWVWRASRRLASIDLITGRPDAALARLREVGRESARLAVRPEMLETVQIHADVLAARGERIAAARIWRLVATDAAAYGASRARAVAALAALDSDEIAAADVQAIGLDLALAALLADDSVPISDR
jgi:tetratricopeptide (TPR) repeat protein